MLVHLLICYLIISYHECYRDDCRILGGDARGLVVVPTPFDMEFFFKYFQLECLWNAIKILNVNTSRLDLEK